MTFRVNTHYPAHMDYTKTNPIEQQRTHGSHSLLYQIPAVPSRSKAHLQSIRSEKEKRIRPLNLLALMHFKAGGEGGDRTLDPRLMSPLLYRLSYLAPCSESNGAKYTKTHAPKSMPSVTGVSRFFNIPRP